MKNILIVVLMLLISKEVLANSLFQDGYDDVGIRVGITQYFREADIEYYWFKLESNIQPYTHTNYSPYVAISAGGILDVSLSFHDYEKTYCIDYLKDLKYKLLNSRLTLLKPTRFYPGVFLEGRYYFFADTYRYSYEYKVNYDIKMFEYGFGLLLDINKNIKGRFGVRTLEVRYQASYKDLLFDYTYDYSRKSDIVNLGFIEFDYRIPISKTIYPVITGGIIGGGDRGPAYKVDISLMYNLDTGLFD